MPPVAAAGEEGQVLLAQGQVEVVAAELDLAPSPTWADDWRAEQEPEPGGCAALAAYLNGRVPNEGRVGVLVCGGNAEIGMT